MSKQAKRDKAFLIGAGGVSGLALVAAVAADCLSTGGALTVATVGTTLFGKAIEAAGGAASGPLVEALRTKIKGTGSVTELLQNHHLENVLRLSVQNALRAVGEEREGDQEALEAIAEEAKSLKFLKPGPDGEPVPAEVLWLVDTFATLPADGLENPLHEDEWRGVVVHLEGLARYRKAPRETKKRTISADTREAVVERLANGFPGIVQEVITSPGGDNPQALAKLMLRLQGETLALVRALAETRGGGTADLDALADALAQQTVALQEWMPEAIRNELAPLLILLANPLRRPAPPAAIPASEPAAPRRATARHARRSSPTPSARAGGASSPSPGTALGAGRIGGRPAIRCPRCLPVGRSGLSTLASSGLPAPFGAPRAHLRAEA